MKKYVMPAIVAAAVVTGAPALAADLKPVYKAAPAPVAFNPWDVAVGGALMTDYNFRGISQSARSPSGTAYFEGRFKPVKDLEFYAGAQAWSVKLITDPSAEVDIYGGVRATWDKWTLDLGVMYYLYPGERQVTGGLPPPFL
ncbi:MAG: TorF family putative porin, partial [Pseudorhodoplanes sp.]